MCCTKIHSCLWHVLMQCAGQNHKTCAEEAELSVTAWQEVVLIMSAFPCRGTEEAHKGLPTAA